MEIETRYGSYWTQDAVAQANILHQIESDPMMRLDNRLSWAQWYLVDRLAQLQAGRNAARDHITVERRIQEIDPNLRLRWEFDHPDGTPMWAIDRFVPELGYNWTIFFWSHRLGDGSGLSQVLRESDMQRPDYMKEKKLAQEMAKDYQEKKRIEYALRCTEGLSRKQCEEFVAVEAALATGEKIHVRGRDADILNRAYEEQRRNPYPAIPGDQFAINPLSNPLRRGR